MKHRATNPAMFIVVCCRFSFIKSRAKAISDNGATLFLGSTLHNFLPCVKLSFVQLTARSVNLIDLPATVESRAKRFFDRAGRMAIGVAFDCSSQHVYWTDVATRAIYKAPISDADAASVVVSGLRSPEGKCCFETF